MPPARSGVLHVPGPVTLTWGGVLDGCDIGWRLFGEGDLPVVVALGGISAGRQVTASAEDPTPGWWEEMVGPERGLDTRRWRVLSIDWLGGNATSTGPAHREDVDAPFPSVDTRDQAWAVAQVLDHLGVERAEAIVGSSYGGMVALAFASCFASRAAHAVVIGAAHESHPMITALRGLQRGMVRMGLETGRAKDGLRMARALGMTTYRGPEEFAERFSMIPAWTADGPRFPVEEYLDHVGERFAAAYPPRAFLCLSESVDLHRVDPAMVPIPVTLVAVESDGLAPLWQVRPLHAALPSSTLVTLVSPYGHDAFLKEIDLFADILRTALGAPPMERSPQTGEHRVSAAPQRPEQAS